MYSEWEVKGCCNERGVRGPQSLPILIGLLDANLNEPVSAKKTARRSVLSQSR